MKGVRTFLDTNIIIYAYDTSAGDKHQKARDLLTGLWESGLGMVSTQVLQEFHVTATRKIPKPLDLATAREIIADFLTWDVVATTAIQSSRPSMSGRNTGFHSGIRWSSPPPSPGEPRFF